MKENFKIRIGAILTSMCLIASCMPAMEANAMMNYSVSTLEAEEKIEPKQNENSEAAMTLKEAINIARSSINIDVEDMEFESRFYDSEALDQRTWSLTWHDEDYMKEYMMTVDVDTKKVINYNYYDSKDYEQENFDKLAKHTYEEGIEVAANLVKTLESDKQDSIKLCYEKQNKDYSKGSNSYEYTFIRLIDGVPFKENQITVSLNKSDLVLRNYNVSWTKKLEGKVEAKVSKEDIEKKFKEDKNLKLVYVQDKKNTKEVKPVYVSKKYHIAYDALTGEEVDMGFISYRDTVNEMATLESAKATADTGGGSSVVLTENEIAETENVNKVLSKEKSMEIASKYLEKGYNVTSTRLQRRSKIYKVGGTKEEKVETLCWFISMKKVISRDKTYTQNILINAENGEVLNFSKYMYEDRSKQTPKYTYEAAKKTATSLLETINVEKSKLVLLNEDDHNSSKEKDKKQSSYSFSFVRQLNGIEVPFNTININVDGFTNKVTSYYLSWDEIEDKTGVSKDALKSLDEAYEKFLSSGKFNLEYITKGDYDSKGNFKEKLVLTYKLSNEEEVLIDAINGKAIDRNLKSLEENGETMFKDIEDSWAKDIIIKLVEEGCIRELEYFEPNKAVTKLDAIKLIINALEFKGSDYEMTDDRYIRRAIQNKMISEDEKRELDKEATRLDVAKMVVGKFGYFNVLKYKDIFKNNFIDVNDDAIPVVALVNAEGILKGEGNYFKPYDGITKAEVATVIYRMLNK